MDQFLLPTNAFNAELHQQKLIDMLMEHDQRDDLCREEPGLNKYLDGTLTGQQVMYLQVKPEAMIKFFNQSGCLYNTVGTTDAGKQVPHYTPKEINDKVLLFQVFRHSCARYINTELQHHFPHQQLVGVQYYFDTPTPEAHLLYKLANEATTSKTKDKEYQNPLDPASHNHLKPERLVNIRLQQATNDDDDKQDKPDKQPIVDDTLQRQRQLQAVHQQVNAVADEDNENESNHKLKLIPTGSGDPKVLAHLHELSKKRQLRNNIKRQLRNKQYLAQEEATQPHLHITKANPQQTHHKESDGPSM